MALTVPSTDDLATFQGEDEVENDAQATFALQMAADLLWLATNAEDDPTDPRLARIVKNAICDMAWFLLIQTQDREETYSGHSSERIGSYSYTKAQKAISLGERTGVFWFDAARDALAQTETGIATTSVTSSWVFETNMARESVPASVRFDYYA